MAPKNDRWLKSYATALSEEKYSEKTRLAESKDEIMNTKPNPMSVRSQATIKRLRSLTLKENPPTQTFTASKLETISNIASKIIHKDLMLKKRL
ncbi:hypothetical protein TNCV_4181291 [Trichonephila clavipes]|nr:hypothetical protein TNCV_4181291 [Trichonephila clavipes]